MSIRKIFYVTLCLFLVLGACKSDKAGTKKAKAEEMASEKTETVKTHLGDCIRLSPAGEVPEDLYQIGDVVPTGEYKPFTKKLSGAP